LFSRKGAGKDFVPTDQLALNNVLARVVDTPSGSVGYVRIFGFDAEDAETFVNGMASVLKQLPSTGVIIDVRSNPGGLIPGGEGMLQLFTQQLPSTAPVSFRNTNATKRLGQQAWLLPWKRSLDMQLETGEVFTQGFPISTTSDGPRGVY